VRALRYARWRDWLLAGLLGLMGGVFLAFFTEFASLVKAQLTET